MKDTANVNVETASNVDLSDESGDNVGYGCVCPTRRTRVNMSPSIFIVLLKISQINFQDDANSILSATTDTTRSGTPTNRTRKGKKKKTSKVPKTVRQPFKFT